MILVYTTCSNKEEADKISNHLLDKRLCACTNMFPIESSYWWKGKKEKAEEYVLIIKTISAKFNIIKEEIKKIHSYDTPCILKIEIADGNKEYVSWIGQEVR